MARISASVYTSHVPAVGAALDLGKTKEAYWQPVFAGYDASKAWIKEHMPDVVFLVYNDHATAFSLEMIPTFAIGTAAEFKTTPMKASPVSGRLSSGPRRSSRTFTSRLRRTYWGRIPCTSTSTRGP